MGHAHQDWLTRSRWKTSVHGKCPPAKWCAWDSSKYDGSLYSVSSFMAGPGLAVYLVAQGRIRKRRCELKYTAVLIYYVFDLVKPYRSPTVQPSATRPVSIRAATPHYQQGPASLTVSIPSLLAPPGLCTCQCHRVAKLCGMMASFGELSMSALPVERVSTTTSSTWHHSDTCDCSRRTLTSPYPAEPRPSRASAPRSWTRARKAVAPHPQERCVPSRDSHRV